MEILLWIAVAIAAVFVVLWLLSTIGSFLFTLTVFRKVSRDFWDEDDRPYTSVSTLRRHL